MGGSIVRKHEQGAMTLVCKANIPNLEIPVYHSFLSGGRDQITPHRGTTWLATYSSQHRTVAEQDLKAGLSITLQQSPLYSNRTSNGTTKSYFLYVFMRMWLINFTFQILLTLFGLHIHYK